MELRPTGRACLCVLRGELDFSSAVQLREAADQVLATLPRPEPLVIDCTALSFCDSSGISALIHVYQRLSAQGGTLRLAAVPGSVARVFRLTGLDQVISVYATASDALADREGVQASVSGGTSSPGPESER
ncbi:STAS domain-containing protein [Streptomyces sp. NPDC015171]|uniref:STAS domain-containing protein n=1 Tax=Streptomyces sp. NPDC015171 TaxID=3364945 RepID=UPI0036FC530E